MSRLAPEVWSVLEATYVGHPADLTRCAFHPLAPAVEVVGGVPTCLACLSDADLTASADRRPRLAVPGSIETFYRCRTCGQVAAKGTLVHRAGEAEAQTLCGHDQGYEPIGVDVVRQWARDQLTQSYAAMARAAPTDPQYRAWVRTAAKSADGIIELDVLALWHGTLYQYNLSVVWQTITQTWDAATTGPVEEYPPVTAFEAEEEGAQIRRLTDDAQDEQMRALFRQRAAALDELIRETVEGWQDDADHQRELDNLPR